MTFNHEDSPMVNADPPSQEQCKTERLTNAEIEQLRQAQNEAVAYGQKMYPNLKILKH